MMFDQDTGDIVTYKDILRSNPAEQYPNIVSIYNKDLENGEAVIRYKYIQEFGEEYGGNIVSYEDGTFKFDLEKVNIKYIIPALK